MFSNVAFSALAFIVALGLLIAIHEFGHFWVARKVGVKVLRFSVGFGKPLCKRVSKRDQTEFVLAAIPLGGYVKMLDEREGPVDSAEASRAFNRQPLWARAAVVVAGPVANLLLAIAAWWVVMMMGISGVAPYIGPVADDSAAGRAGFIEDDLLQRINGTPVPTWTDARITLIDSALEGQGRIQVEVQTKAGLLTERTLVVPPAEFLKAEGDAVAAIGFQAWQPRVLPVVGTVVAGGAADKAGLQAGDRVVSVDGESIADWRSLVAAIQPRAGEDLSLQIQRAGAAQTLNLAPEVVELDDGRRIGRIGITETQSEALLERARVTVRHAPVAALGAALERTWSMSALTLRMFGKLLTGQASLDNISGPVTIAQVAGQTATIGLDHYINFIALISVSLAILNLLPIPLLDGGHLLYFAFEAIRGKPLSERVQGWGQQVGIALLASLMCLAFYNDFWRLMS